MPISSYCNSADVTASVRFAFFFMQAFCMLSMAAAVAVAAIG